MKPEDLFQAIGQAEEAWLAQSEARPRRRRIWPALAVAACLVLILGLWQPWNTPASTDPTTQTPPVDPPVQTDPVDPVDPVPPEEPTPELPTLTLPEPQPDGMGYYTILSSDLDTMLADHPGTGLTADTLPVYQNTAYTDGSYIPPALDQELAQEQIQTAAQALGLTIQQVTCYDQQGLQTTDGPVHRMEAQADGCLLICTSGSSHLALLFDQPVDLPAADARPAADADPQATVDYLAQTYAPLLGYTDPRTAISGDEDYNGDLRRRYLVYEGAEDPLTGYHLQWTQFQLDDNGDLSGIWLSYTQQVVQPLGDYPLIGEAAARQKLLAGDYLPPMAAEPIQETDIAAVELVYRTNYSEQHWMPYYRYWVQVPSETGIPTYATYDVPAVQEQYLQAPTANTDTLEQLVTQLRSQYGLTQENFSLCYYNTITGESYQYNPDAWMVAASTYKLPLNLYYYEQEAAGTLSPETVIAGTPLSEIHYQSLVYSNNPLSDALRTNLGDYWHYRTLMIESYSDYDPESIPDAVKRRNFYCTGYMLQVLQYIWDRADQFPELLDHLRQAAPDCYFKKYVTDYPIAHKFGSYEGAENDVGIVYTDQPYLLAVYTYQLADGEDVVGRINQAICRYNTTR